MAFDPDIHDRRSVRLPGFDYGQLGSYFVTICTLGRRCIFGEVVDGKMILSPVGAIAAAEWEHTLTLRDELVPSSRVTMPNHVHMIVRIQWMSLKDARQRMPPSGRFEDGMGRRTLACIVNGYKGAVTLKLKKAGLLPAGGVWQRGFYEHVIRHEYALERIATYIASNPLTWETDRENPRRVDDQPRPT